MGLARWRVFCGGGVPEGVVILTIEKRNPTKGLTSFISCPDNRSFGIVQADGRIDRHGSKPVKIWPMRSTFNKWLLSPRPVDML